MKEKNTWTDKGAKRIAKLILAIQRRTSRSMNTLIAGMPKGRLRLIVILFGLTGGGYSLYLAAAAFSRTSLTPQIDSIRLPHNFGKTGEVQPDILVDSATFHQIQTFKQSQAFDSLLKAQPGFQDSIRILEKIYHLQK